MIDSPMFQADFIQVAAVASALVAGVVLLLMVRVVPATSVRWAALQVVLRFTGSVLLAAGMLGTCLFLMGGLGFFAWIIMVGIWMRAAMNRRTVQRRNLFSALALAIDKQMPLGPMASAFAAEQEAGFAIQVRGLARGFEHGAGFDEALRHWRHVLPNDSALVAHIGRESGDLDSALQAATYASSFDRSLIQPVIGRFFYVSVVLVYLVAILTFLQIKIGPSFVKIFDDYGAPMPLSFLTLVRSTFVLQYVGMLLPWVLVGLGLYAWLQWRGTLYPRLPGMRSIINWLDMGPVLRMLALAARRDKPFSGVFRAVAQDHPKRSVRGRMWPVAFETDDGQPWQECLRRRRLISANDAALLSAAQRSGNLSWALSEMAASFERKAALRLQALSQVLLPLVMLPIGMFVALVALAYFAPIAKLITDLS